MDSLSLEKLPEFDGHKMISFIYDMHSGLRGFIAIHRGNTEHPAFGATRLWQYTTETEALRDALRLSRMMSYKSALAGLPYGGGKGVIMMSKNQNTHKRTKLLNAYAGTINDLSGLFITGTDVGLTQRDVQQMKRKSNYFVGLEGDPTDFTGLGLLCGVRICLKEIFGKPSLTGKSIAIQGLGKIGTKLLDLVYPEAERIFVCDVDTQRVLIAKKRFPRIQQINNNEIHKAPVDIFAPCALSGSLNKTTVKEIQASIIAGGANNQLEKEEIGDLLYERGILYAPDYVLNAGGLMCVADEYEHPRFSAKRVAKRVAGIQTTLINIFSRSKKLHQPPHRVANELAERIINHF